MNNNLFMLSYLHFIYGFLVEADNFNFINETNRYINNYKTDSPLNVITSEFKTQFLKKHVPLTLTLSSRNLTSIFMMCADFISEENLYAINKIFDSENLLKKSLTTKSKIEITNVIKPCKINEQISIYNGKLKNFSLENHEEKKEVTFSRIDVILKLEEIHLYVFTTDFIKNLEASKFKKYKELVKNMKCFENFQTEFIHATCQNENIKLTLPEFYILGIWSFLKENSETSTIVDLPTKCECEC